MTLEVYGCGYDQDIDEKNYKNREELSHRNEAIKVL